MAETMLFGLPGQLLQVRPYHVSRIRKQGTIDCLHHLRGQNRHRHAKTRKWTHQMRLLRIFPFQTSPISTFPPDSTQTTFLSSTPNLPLIAAATVTAEEGSISCFIRSSTKVCAVLISSSETSTDDYYVKIMYRL